ncbi:MAG TPA: hypothetical protein VFZ41_08350 [Solirubrobacterales bacterium]
MTITGLLRRRLKLAGGERGMALPTALFALIASFGLATAAIFASIDAQRGTKYDSGRKNAIAAADAGVSVAQMRLNRFQGLFDETTRCVGPLGEPLAETSTGSGWCPPSPAETVGGSTFSYQVSAYNENKTLNVVSVGTSGAVSRRVEVGLISYDGTNVFADEHLIGQDEIELDGDVEIKTDIGTNGNVINKGKAYFLCGNVRHGIGKGAPEPHCEGEVLEGEKQLPAIVPPADIETNNSNCRLTATCPNDPNKEEVDPYSKNITSTNPWDPNTRTINIEQNAVLTMGGADYFVCGLFMKNGTLIMPAGSNIRIFIDTPESCGLGPGALQVEITGSANVKSTAYDPDLGQFDIPGIYVLGSPEIPTDVKLCGNSSQIENELMLYAPYSDVEICGNAKWTGMIAGKTIWIHGNPTIEADPGIEPPEITLEGLWERTRYVECTGPTATPPNASC